MQFQEEKLNKFVDPNISSYLIFPFFFLRKMRFAPHFFICVIVVHSACAVSSILTHCRLEQAAYCFNRDDPVQCLVSNRQEMFDGSLCKKWLDARHECFVSVSKSTICSPLETKLQCLVRLPLDDISVACSGSEFFSTLKRDAALFVRHRH